MADVNTGAAASTVGLRSAAELVDYVETVGVNKSRQPLQSTMVLGILAGMFIGLGSMVYTLVTSDTTLSFAARQLLGGLTFCLGLVLVVVAGAELFTGNVLMVVAWSRGKITGSQVLRNWLLVLLANLIGSVLLGVLVLYSGTLGLNKGAVAVHALEVAGKKDGLNFLTAFVSAIMCNLLVCLAVWLSYAGRTVADKILAVIFPIMTFVACGFEHSVADMYFLPLGLMLRASGVVGAGVGNISLGETVAHLIVVILGNIVGGGLLVGLLYHWAYRPKPATA
ncbi:formate/nitrite transporter family protein [Deinococcus radiomollis]|uniref:formate/nitrite transporter family protein n=1 Tax=Deinococcus radiomollis TaxID=468916 RepID=UPI003891D178